MTQSSREPAFIKLFGERNTATNAVQALVDTIATGRRLPSTAADIDSAAFAHIQEQFRDRPQAREAALDDLFARAGTRSSWKHCATTFDDAAPFADCLVLFTVRHPASWLSGLFANSYHALSPVPPSIAEFIRFDWRTVDRERLKGKSFLPLQLYDAKLRSYDSFAAKLEAAQIPFRFIRFEDVVLAQEQVFRTLAADLGRPDASYEPLLRSTKDPARGLDDYRRYYGQESWRADLAGSEEAINAAVDWALVDRFGYRPL